MSRHLVNRLGDIRLDEVFCVAHAACMCLGLGVYIPGMRSPLVIKNLEIDERAFYAH